MDLLPHLKALPRWLWLGLAGFTGAYAYAQLHAGHPM